MADDSPWGRFKQSLNQAIVGGIAGYLAGKGAPGVVLNPFLPLTKPGSSYGPENYRGIGNMGRRLRLAENESSPPMRVLKTAVEKNPLLQGMETAVEEPGSKPGGLPSGLTGAMAWRGKAPPKVFLAPRVDPQHDPTLTATHEVVGHGSHGNIAGGTPEVQENYVRPRGEGLAVGVEKGVYGPLKLALPSGYDEPYGQNQGYQQGLSIGEAVAKHMLKTEKVPSQEKVLGYLFAKGAPAPVPKPPQVPMGGGS